MILVHLFEGVHKMYTVNEPSLFDLYVDWMKINYSLANNMNTEKVLRNHINHFKSVEEKEDFMERYNQYSSRLDIKEVARKNYERAIRNIGHAAR
jgi:hypothetical protein